MTTIEQHRDISDVPTAMGWMPAPYAMVRVNPVAPQPTPGADRLDQALDLLAELEADQPIKRQAALDECYELVPRVGDVERKLLLRTSRAIGRGAVPQLTAEQLAGLREPTPSLAAWLAHLTAREELMQRVVTEHEAALLTDRERLQDILRSEAFLLAAAITSPDMARSAIHYATHPVRDHTRRTRKHEPKLARYAERAVAKTSPFSHFTVVAAAEWARTGSAGTSADRVRVRTEMNLLLVHRLLDAALTDPQLAQAIPYRQRQGIELVDGAHHFEVMRDNPGRSRIYRTDRARVSVKATPTSGLVLQLLDRVGGAATLRDLATALMEAATNSSVSKDALLTYLTKLQSSGLLVPAIEIRDNVASAAEDLAGQLDRVGTPEALELSEQLRQLHTATDRISATDAQRRPAAVAALRDAWESAFARWGVEVAIDSPAYEDVAVEETVALDIQRWDAVRHDLQTLLPALEPLNMDHPGQVLMRMQGIDRFGRGFRCGYADFVKLLPDVFTAERVSLTAILDEVGGRDTDLTHLLELRERLLEMVQSSGDEVVLDEAELREIAGDVPPAFRRRNASVSAFVQPVDDVDGHIHTATLNACLDGHGQFLSRFLPLWDDARTDAVRRHVRSTLPAGATELRPVHGFNANVHPRILEREFAINDVGESPADVVNADDLYVRHDTETDQLVLEDAGGNAVDPLYLGFLVPYLLPWEQTALYLLSRPSQLRIDFANELERRVPDEQAEQVRHYARVRYGSLVLSRARWYVPRDLFPFPEAGEDESAHLRRLDAWRISRGMPKGVFLAALPRNGAETRDNLGRPKPMFVDLRSPLHAKYLATWLKGADVVRVEEALPVPGAAPPDPAFGNRTCEFLIEYHQQSEPRAH